MHFTNKYVSAQVIHSPTATVASSASSQEKALRSSLETTRDVAAAAKIGKILAERLLLKDIPAVSIHLKREQKYHGKVKAVIDSLRDAGIKLLWVMVACSIILPQRLFLLDLIFFSIFKFSSQQEVTHWTYFTKTLVNYISTNKKSVDVHLC